MSNKEDKFNVELIDIDGIPHLSTKITFPKEAVDHWTSKKVRGIKKIIQKIRIWKWRRKWKMKKSLKK